jgi:DNA-binding NarL/FixJ family response regulator
VIWPLERSVTIGQYPGLRGGQVGAIRIAVVEEHEIFRRGIVACLSEDPALAVVVDAPSGPVPDELDVAVASVRAAREERFPCPIVVCAPDTSVLTPAAAHNAVSAMLPRTDLTKEQLVATVRAAAAGLFIRSEHGPTGARSRMDTRRLEVLRLLAEGAGTQEISAKLRYSERTIKGLIGEIERALGAKSRAQAVAQGIRQGLI